VAPLRRTDAKTAATAAVRTSPAPASWRSADLPLPAVISRLTAAEKVAHVERIRRDYDEMRAKVAADYAAAGGSFPGGLSAFLRQLALLEREKRADLAAVLDAVEFETWERRETPAGQLVQRLLGDTVATEEQRAAAFRLRREFDDRFALSFDLTPQVLWERETARQALQAELRAVLGDALFAAWLRGEGDDFARFGAFVSRQGLAPGVAFELWQTKNTFLRQRLEAAARPGVSPEALRATQAVLVREAEERVAALVGPGLLPLARSEVLDWLPGK
jgi:hypothetical protein